MKNKRDRMNQMDIYKKLRKPMPPATRVINPKKKYDRRDNSWKEDIS